MKVSKTYVRSMAYKCTLEKAKTIKDLLVAPKVKDSITKKSGIIYRYKCDRLECDEEYIGESARMFGERYREHLKAPSPIYDHSNHRSCHYIGQLQYSGKGGSQPHEAD